jgi:para-aminobenzoate synthetase/4-amino-4-deoxychorismate lyase
MANDCLIHDRASGRWLAFHAPRAVVVAWRPEEVRPALVRVEAAVEGEGRWAAGFLAYEAAPAFDPALRVRAAGDFPLLWLGVYDAPVVAPAPPPSGPVTLTWAPSIAPGAYRDAIAGIRRRIRAGETYQVNFTYRLRAAFAGDPEALFAALVQAQGPGYAARVDTGRFVVCSASPELFLARDGERVLSRPMKGTRPRAPAPGQDLEVAAALAGSVKDRAENVMIVDMVRNDLGRVAEPGSVRVPRLFALERYPTVWQMTSDVEARVRGPTADLLAALFPPASVTGAPKPRTLSIIAALETSPRRVYTGCVGYLAPGRRAQLNVAIRTVLVDRRQGTAEYGVGGGIVWDSRAGAELEETRAKARVLFAARPPFALLETLRWDPEGGYALLECHLERLAGSAAYFGFPPVTGAAREALAACAAGLPRAPHRVRLVVEADGRARTEARALEGAEAPRPLQVALAPWPVDPADPFLYHKTTRRGVYEQARASRPGYDDVLLWNPRGELTESCLANLVVELEGGRFTPPVACGLLAGTYRGWLLASGRVRERVLTVADLARATRVLLVNSVRGEREAVLGPDLAG